MKFNNIGVLPVLTVGFALCAFFAGYGIAIGNDHVDAWIPFISDCGALNPERSVFSQLLNISMFFLAITIYLMHRKIMTFYNDNNVEIGKWKAFARFTFLLGLLSALGGSMVANFPESDELVTHSVGAFLFFISIILYFWCIVIINYSLRPKLVAIHLTNFRLLLTFSLSLILIFHMIVLFVQPFVTRINGELPPQPTYVGNIVRPNSTSPYYSNHIVAAVSEWVLALLILVSILTFSFEFATTVYHAPRLSQWSTASKDTVSNDTPIINQKETRLTHYDAFSSPYGALAIPDHYSETQSTSRRLPRVDKIYTTGTLYSSRLTANNGPTYNGY